MDYLSSSRVKRSRNGYIKEKDLSNGDTRFYAEVQLKRFLRLTATFSRKSHAKLWIQKTETELRFGRNQLVAELRKYVFKDAAQRYSREQKISVVKRGHLQWWEKELGHYFLKDIRPSLIAEKKQKLLTETTEKGVVRSGSTCKVHINIGTKFLHNFEALMAMGCHGTCHDVERSQFLEATWDERLWTVKNRKLICSFQK